MTPVTPSDTVKSRRLGTVDVPPERAGGDVKPLPPMGRSLAIVLLTLVAAGVAFGVWLSRHQPQPGWLALFGGLAAVWVEMRTLPGLRERAALRRARKEGRRLIKGVELAIKKQKDWVGSQSKQKIEDAIKTLEQALPGTDLAAIEFATKSLDELADASLARKPAGREVAEQIGGAVLAALLLRAFCYEAFKIPSGSMIPTLLEGDHLFVNKFVYGLRIPFTLDKVLAQVPKRGDIVVFNRPGDESGDDIIKRVIGLPGDRIEVRDRQVSVNGAPFEVKPLETVRLNKQGDPVESPEDGQAIGYQQFEETVGEHHHVAQKMLGYPQGEAYGNEGVWMVEPGHVFVMGDNRDNSQDSRFPRPQGFGQVPIEYIKGRADIIWLSLGGPHGLRFGRMFHLLH